MKLKLQIWTALSLCLIISTGYADNPSGGMGSSLPILKEVMQNNIAALQEGCAMTATISVNIGGGAPVPLNTERRLKLAIRGASFTAQTWFSAKYDMSTKSMIATNDNDTKSAFNGSKYIQSAGSHYIVSSNPAKTYAVFDAFSVCPLTAMFAFLVQRQGYVLYSNIANPSAWSSYFSDIKNVSYDSAGDLIVATVRADGVKQEVTFSKVHEFYPSKIIVKWGDQWCSTEVLNWTKVDVFGPSLEFLPQTILSKVGGKGVVEEPLWKIVLDPQSISGLPKNQAFKLPVDADSRIYDLDHDIDVRIPKTE